MQAFPPPPHLQPSTPHPASPERFCLFATSFLIFRLLFPNLANLPPPHIAVAPPPGPSNGGGGGGGGVSHQEVHLHLYHRCKALGAEPGINTTLSPQTSSAPAGLLEWFLSGIGHALPPPIPPLPTETTADGCAG